MRLPALLLAFLFSGCLSASPGILDDADTVPTPPLVPLHEETFKGTAPAAVAGLDTVVKTFEVSVPEGAKRLLVTHNATYTGFWPSRLYLSDPTDNQRSDSGECDRPAPVLPTDMAPDILGEYSCTIDIGHDVKAGTWNIVLSWQVGEVAEEYTIDTEVWGLA